MNGKNQEQQFEYKSVTAEDQFGKENFKCENLRLCTQAKILEEVYKKSINVRSKRRKKIKS